jgi:hypothetical protein
MDEKRARDLAGQWLQFKDGPGDVDLGHLWVAANALIDLVPEPDLWTFVAPSPHPEGVPMPEGAKQIPRDLLILATGALFRIGGMESNRLYVVVRRFPTTVVGFPVVVEHREDERDNERRYREWLFPLPGADMVHITTDQTTSASAVPSASELIAERLASLSGWQVGDALHS